MNQSPGRRHFAWLSRTSYCVPGVPRQWLLGLAVVIVFLFAPSCMVAQKTTAKTDNDSAAALRGTVTAQDGSALAGATVKLIRKAPTGTPARAETDENGHYEFLNLEPGDYAISGEGEGFKRIERAVLLQAGDQKVQDFRLEVEAVRERVEVSGLATIISTESASAPVAVVTNTQLVTLPTSQEKVKEVIPMTPGVVQTLDSKLVFKGSDENQSLLIINSTRNTDPVTGSFGITVPTDAVESFAVYKTPYDASLGSFSGGVTTIETKPPADGFDVNVNRLGITLLGKNGHMAGLGGANPAFSFDVPLIAHKLLLSESFQYEMKKTTVEGLPWPYDISKRQGFNSFATLEAILAKNHILTMTLNVFPLRTDHIDISALVPQPTSNNLNQRGMAVAASDRYEFESGSVLSVMAQYTRFDSTAQGQGSADMLITPQGWGGNYFNDWSRRGKELQFLTNYEFPKKQWLGSHEIRVGEDIDWRSYFGVTESRPIQILREDGSLAETIDFAPAPAQIRSDSIFAEFVQDHWLVNSHFSVDLGLRLSTETSGWPAKLAPRLGLAYSPSKDEKTVIRAGAGFFYGVLPLLAANWPGNPTQTITEYGTSGLPIAPPVTYANAYTAGLNPLVSPVLPTQPNTTPRNFTWNAGMVRELRKDLHLELSFLNSRTTYLFEVEPFTAAAASDESFMALTNTGSSRYYELEASVHYKLRQSDQVNASYIWSRARGDLNSLSNVMIPFAAPVIRPDVYGVLPSDIPNRVIAWGIFALPWKVTFSPLVDVHSGFPYSPVDVTQQYVGAPNGRRFPDFFSLDFKAYRAFRVPFLKGKGGRGHHFRLGVYSLNLTNHGNYSTVYNNVTSPNFGQFVGFLYRHEGMTLDFVD
ncbi:MAG TPA: carboxypeptidase regulatory-like domain-containing protein [Candidatus Acidoferrum sp.]|nr:carboxypeptidase regulatory-like domain-containing protein [Candidatus Acidoferrum sp.]